MRSGILGLLLLAMSMMATAAFGAAEPKFHAGMTRLTVEAAEPFEALVWYPTAAAESSFQVGPYAVAAARDAPVAAGPTFAVVVLSHGRRGNPLGHRELAAALARDGFIVVAPTHIGDSSVPAPPRPQRQVLADRPQQARAALERVLADPRFATRADATRIAAVGFSAGGYTALVLAGARPSLSVAMAYCRTHPQDEAACGPAASNAGTAAPAPGRGDASNLPTVDDGRIKALVLMDPLAILFDRDGLAPVRMPTLIVRPEDDSYLRSAGNALALVGALPAPPQQIVVPGRHFIFLDPCPAPLAETAPLLCQDAPGIDRAAIHRRLEAEISAFLRSALPR